MLGKLLVIILAAAATAAMLLALRQQRIDTAHEMSLVYQQMLQHERSLWLLQSEIAYRCRPEEVRHMMEQLSEQWKTIPDQGVLDAEPSPTASAQGSADDDGQLGG